MGSEMCIRDSINYGTGRNDFVFMKDNASVHRSNHSKEWFEEFDMDDFSWLALSSDLNPIEIVWGALAFKILSLTRR